MADLAANPNDLGASYAAGMQTASADDALRRLRAMAGEVEPMAAAPAAPRTTAPQLLDTPGAGTTTDAGPRGTVTVEVLPDDPAGGWAGKAVDVAGTVARNTGDAGMQILNAPFAALREMFRAADDIGNALSGAAPVAEKDATFAANPGRAIARNVPQIASEPDTPAGKVAKDISQFLAGFIGGGKVVKALAGKATTAGGKTAQAMTAGAMADFFARPATQERLVKLWADSGLPGAAMAEYLNGTEDEPAAQQRLRNAVEGLAVGAAIDSVLALVGVAKGVRAAKSAPSDATKAAEARAVADAEAMAGAAMRGLGNPDPLAPLVTRDVMGLAGGNAPAARAVEAGDPGRKMAEAAAATSDAATGVDAYTTAKGLLGRLREFAAPAWVRGEPLSEAETMAAGAAADAGSIPAGVRDLLTAMRRGAVGPKGEVSLVSFLVKNGGIKDDAGDLKAVLGTARARPGLLNKGGKSFDDAIQAAREAGYFDDVAASFGREAETLAGKLATGGRDAEAIDKRALLDAIDEDLRGNGARYGTTTDAAGRAVADAAAELESILGPAGLSPRSTDAEIGALFRDLDEGAPGGAGPGPDIAAEMDARMAGQREGSLPLVENTSAVRAAKDTGPVYVNWARVQTPDDVQALMRDTADAFRGDINAAGRSVQSNAETAKLADELGMSVNDLLSRRSGEPLNAEATLAARRLLTASGEKLAEMARLAAAPNATPSDAWAFRRMLATHYAVQAEVLAARRETARALQSWSIPAGSAREQQRAIEQMLEQSGGVVTAAAMAKRLDMLTQAGASPAAIGAFARSASMASTIGSAVQEVWINGLLSSPKTHMVNVLSNTFTAALGIGERRAAEMLGGDVQPGEAGAMLYGMVTGLRDALRLAGRTYRDGTGEVGAMIGKVDVPHERAVSSQAFGMDAGSGLGQAIDFIGHSVVSAPSRALGAEDAFFKSIGYRMEVHAGALRMAREEALIAGKHAADSPAFAREVADRMKVLVNDPPEALRLQAADMALYQTFNRQAGPWASGLMGLREKMPALTFVLPFIRTPMNVLSYSFERTPLAPLVGQWRADIAAGGARRELALTRMATGSAMMALAFDMADRGEITGAGPDDPGEVESMTNQGIPKYSVRIGDQWFSYSRFDPFGFTFGFAADFADMVRRRQVEPEEVDSVDEILAAAMATVSRSVVDKTWMQGVSGLMAAMDNPERDLKGWLAQMAGSVVPAAVGQAEQAFAPASSLSTNPAEAIMARLPGLSAELPPRRNRWGEVVANGGQPVPETRGRAALDAFSPVRVVDERDSPVDAEMQRLNLGLGRLPMAQTLNGAAVNLRAFPRAYDDLVRLAGNGTWEGGPQIGLKDALAEMIAGGGALGSTYARMSDGKDGGKAVMIQHMVNDYRAMARQHLLSMPEHAELAALVGQRQREAAQARMPILE